MADFSDWDSKIFGYRVGTHHYTDLPRDIGDTKGLDVVFSRGPYRGQLPDRRSTVFEVQVDLSFGGRPNAAPPLPLADVSNFDDVIDIAEATLTDHRWGRDSRLSPRAGTFYRRWLFAAHERRQVRVLSRAGTCLGFIVTERDPTSDVRPVEDRLSLIAVNPSYQRRGYGKLLLASFLGQGIGRYRVKTWIDNVSALNLYLSNGFRIESVECVEHVWLI